MANKYGRPGKSNQAVRAGIDFRGTVTTRAGEKRCPSFHDGACRIVDLGYRDVLVSEQGLHVTDVLPLVEESSVAVVALSECGE